jgi:hypothetical protein
MGTGISKLYADRYEDFRRMQESLRNLFFDGRWIDLLEIAEDNVVLDEKEIFTISKIPTRGDYVIVTHDATDYEKAEKEKVAVDVIFVDSPMNLTSLSMSILDKVLRLMKKALIITEIRSLN